MAITKVSPGLLDLNSGITISTADNSDNLTLTSTDADASSGPNLNLYRNSSSPADSDEIGNIAFNGRNDNSQDVKYAEIESYGLDVSDGTEDGLLNFNVIQAGTVVSFFKGNNTEVVVNDDSKDLDFRVETDANTHGLYVDSTANRVSIGGDGSVTRGNPKLLVELGNFNYVEIKGAADSTANGILFSDGGSGTHYGVVGYNHTSDYLNFYSASTQRLRVDADGVKFGTDSAAANALDDYEEGTWTPAIASGASDLTTSSYVAQQGHYTKVGRLVHVIMTLGFVVNDNGTGPLLITGLPYTQKNDSGSRITGHVDIYNYDSPSNIIQIGIEGVANSTSLTTLGSRDGTTWYNIQSSELADGGTYYIKFTGSYVT